MNIENSPETRDVQQNPATVHDEDLHRALEEANQRIEEYLNNWRRAQADFINYKRHSEQEKQETSRIASGTIMLCVLPALDDLERALGSAPPEMVGAGWIEGFRLIEHKLRCALEAQGLKAIKAIGEPFDPRFHEAIKFDEGPEGIVLTEVEKGYLLQDKLLRPSKVIVGRAESEDNQNKEEQVRWQKL